MTARRFNAVFLYSCILLQIQTVPAYSTSRFRIRDLFIAHETPSACCKSGNATCSCDVQLSFCAGVRFPDKKHYKDCHYIHFQTPFLSADDFPYNADVPISIRWPVTEWQLTVSGHDRKGESLLEVSRFFQNISSHSPVTDMTIENDNVTISFSFSVECEQNFYGPTCTVFCNETFRDQHGGSFKCSPDGKKQCERGWGGPLCNEPQCDQSCEHGTCTSPNTCRCDVGWQGSSCSECVPLAGCLHGSCRRAHECVCYPNWGGMLCDVDLDYCSSHRGVCKNGGVCIADAVNSFKCNCLEGFEGPNCERRKQFDCSMLNCGNGVCVMKPTPTCVYREGEVSKSASRIDFYLVLLVLLMVVLCLSVFSVVIRLVCENLEVIYRMRPFNFSSQWVTTTQVSSRRTPSQYEKGIRSMSPPPSYDTGQHSSSRRPTTVEFVDEATL